VYEEEFDQFSQTGAGWWIHVISIIVYGLVIIAYAIQTLELVSWLFPDDNWFMRIITVFVCDGCATGYAFAEMFYRYRLRRSKNLTFGMWVITFALSTAATIIQMYLSSTHNIPHLIEPGIITIAYGLVIVAFVANIIAITVIIRMEHNASQPERYYLDDPHPRRKHTRPRQIRRSQVKVRTAQVTRVPAPRKVIKQLPAPAQVVEEEEPEVEEEEIEEEVEDTPESEELEEEEMEEDTSADEEDQEEETEEGGGLPPLGQRLMTAKEVLFPSSGRMKRT
jgi:hypothetical protein